jgi:adenylylsulfate reductase subunit A
MAPSQTLKWLERGVGPASENVEIEGTEPYIVGGHTASGYWVDTNRETTIHGLFAAGDVAGGCPQKYVTGALVEGAIAAESALAYLDKSEESEKFAKSKKTAKTNLTETMAEGPSFFTEGVQTISSEKQAEYESYLTKKDAWLDIEQLEEAMQKVMDEYAGGISSGYQYNEKRLSVASEKITELYALLHQVSAETMDDLLRIYEVRERLVVCQAVIAHLAARKETRWHSFAENMDYPQQSADWEKYVNSRMVDGQIEILYRPLVKGGERYEHTN